MSAGTPILRQWILVLHSGVVVVDWGDGQYQDIYTGEFLRLGANEISHTAQNIELEMLKRTSRVDAYDAVQAWVMTLPERSADLLD